jgi:protein-disulfide isomerase
MGLGLHFTPMIFVNGVQLRGVFAQNASALAAAVERIAAEAPPAATAAADRPPSAPEKAVEDWRAERAVLLPPDSRPWVLGRDDARVRIVLWGDYQDAAQLPLADGAIRDWIAGRHDARYAFRHFPLDQSCNPSAPVTARPQACRASRAAEAAGLLGGAGAYWRMHAWLLSHQADLSDAALVGAALEAGVDQAALLAMLEEPAVTEGIEEDARAAVPSPGRPPSFLYRDALPTIYVNEKVVPQWQVGGKPVIDRILDAAASE